MSIMKVRIKKLDERAVIPKKAHRTDVGLDLVAISRETDSEGNFVYGTGLAVEIPEGYFGALFPRSSICKKHLVLTNSVGVIDSGYRGEVMAKFKPTLVHTGTSRKVYEPGDRIAQLVILPYPDIEFEESDDLDDSERGTGGYGSTGK